MVMIKYYILTHNLKKHKFKQFLEHNNNNNSNNNNNLNFFILSTYVVELWHQSLYF